MKKIAIFSSSEGSNAANLMRYFVNHPDIMVSVLVSDRKSSNALRKAEDWGVKTFCFDFFKDGFPPDLPFFLRNEGIDLIVLSGYYSLLPPIMIHVFPRKIINMHPSLLPSFGGKGFYGNKPIIDALLNEASSTGISIHYVDKHYDHGELIFKAECSINKDDDLEGLSRRLKELEFEFYPKIIEKILFADTKECLTKLESL